ncbi:hypothetical protein AMJ83_05290 [candidate division WOR_3 bacterium SM23_42]|uniref:Type II secretion system protein GspG C-terminal domain-containing protein n=1 Tax=candidate division WOR_3 bacterium SM23_42 TaxID=1703779 RepID=A0A0S8FSX8_UNCW3|nr:MAG: hypothetical protein AMJ83_05290 [candidate division WOR_3 bacterium SM23_42]
MAKATRGGFTAISLVLSLVILAFVVVIGIAYLGRQQSGASGDTSTPLARARSVECLAQIKKVEMHVHLHYVEKGQYPKALRGLEGVSDSDLRCPVTESLYRYDSETGRIFCPDHTK